jgi:hypothetical protein
MASLAKHAKGSSVQVETAPGSGLFEKILGVVDIEGPNVDAEEYDATDQDSPDDIEEMVAGIKRLGPCNFPVNIFPGNVLQRQLRTDNRTNTVRKYRVVENTGEWTEFNAFVKTYQPQRRVRGLRMANISLRLTSAPDYSDD